MYSKLFERELPRLGFGCMRLPEGQDGEYILGTGKGNPEWNQSAPHGAGRRMSRVMAREKLDMETYREAMKDVYTSSVNTDNLDEAPDAYKPMQSIIRAVKDSVEINGIIRPVYNYKG